MNIVRQVVGESEAPRIIRLYGDVDEDMAKDFTKSFQKVLDTKQTLCPVVICSEGGCVWDAMHIVHILRSSPIPVVTVLAGAAYSAGALIFSCGTEGYRYMGKHASIMLHDIRVEGMDGKCNDIQNEAAEMQRNNEMLFEVMAVNCGKKKKFFRDMVNKAQHIDVYMGAKKAKKYNICNHIGIPSLVHRVEHTLVLKRFRKRKRVNDDDDADDRAGPPSGR